MHKVYIYYRNCWLQKGGLIIDQHGRGWRCGFCYKSGGPPISAGITSEGSLYILLYKNVWNHQDWCHKIEGPTYFGDHQKLCFLHPPTHAGQIRVYLKMIHSTLTISWKNLYLFELEILFVKVTKLNVPSFYT